MSLLAGHYELLDEVGEGPIARLYSGRIRGAMGFSRRVAIRQVQDPAHLDPVFVATWAETASRLANGASPHVEQVFDVVANAESASFVSEWIDGMSLAAVIDAYLADMVDVPWPVAIEVVLQVLRGLDSAHQLAIRHDAVVPSSVRVARDGTVKLTRFGVAPALEAIGADRRAREELGLRHAAPELIDGADADARTDQYGAGALLFTLLAGEPPFDEPPGADRDLTVMTELPDLAVRRPDVPPLLVATVERALRVVPDARFDSVGELQRALRQLLRSHPGAVGPRLLAEVVAKYGPTASPAPSPAPSRKPEGLPAQSTMHVDLDELTELAPPPAEPEPPSQPPEDEPTRGRRYQFEFKKRASPPADESPKASPLLPPPTALADETEVLSLPDFDETPEDEAAPLPLTTRSSLRGLEPAVTEHLDAGDLMKLTLEDADDAPSIVPPRPSVRVPLGLGPAKTEMLDDQMLADLRIDEEE
ncbi:MAG: serine/threonine protein kinase [Sandaracinaceae bacterium]